MIKRGEKGQSRGTSGLQKKLLLEVSLVAALLAHQGRWQGQQTPLQGEGARVVAPVIVVVR